MNNSDQTNPLNPSTVGSDRPSLIDEHNKDKMKFENDVEEDLWHSTRTVLWIFLLLYYEIYDS
mgnify:CR=1 FL=1